MSQTSVSEKTVTRHLAGSESNHWTCANKCGFVKGLIFALCGTDVTDMEESDTAEIDCVVCLDIEFCPVCDPPLED